ncbi:hypothetical protein C1H46_011126 [Malus baccata]|uniref:PGG domain-containing protein n=1 Tax=Malus baccata TaxID=106549 RepID=A0A540MWQ4_MALBA|nr:hypothetical protein C1H46_011126 [Malus baccata]
MFLVGEDGSGSTSHSTNESGKTPLCMAAETANLELVKAMVDKTPNSTIDANSGNFWQGSNGNSILRSAIIWRKQAKGGLKKYDAVFVLVMLMLWYINIPLFVLLAVVWAWVTSIAKGGLKKYDAVFVLVMLMLWNFCIPLFFLLAGVVCLIEVSQWWLPRTNRKKYTNVPLSLLFSIAVFALVMSILINLINPLFVMVGVICWIFFKSVVSQWWLPRANRKKYTNLLETILSKMDSADLINSMDQGWMSPLTVAAYMDNFVAVRILLHKFTGLAYKGDENQLLPIHVASKKGHCRVVEEFLDYCPDLRESSDHEGRNILHLAAAHGRVDVVRYIIGKRDLQVLSKQRDQSGNTPLHIAVQNWHPKIVKILSLFHAYERANLNSLNNAGETALDLAEKTGVDKEMLFRRKLTLMALNLANAPRSEERTVSKETQDSVPKSLHNSDNLMFSKESVNTLLLVSTLVVGITFAQGFTVPGGYSDTGNNVGTPNFLPHSLFRIFLICNTVAMCGSITASIALMWAQTYDPSIIYAAMRFTLPVLGVTLTMMSSSFLAGVALTVYHVLWLRIFVYALGLSFTVFIVGLLAPLIDVPVSYETIPTRAILFVCFDLLVFVSGYN